VVSESSDVDLKTFRVGDLDVLTWKRGHAPRQVVSIHNAVTGDLISDCQLSGATRRKLRRALLQLQLEDFRP
jgi:hypothetical protein